MFDFFADRARAVSDCCADRAEQFAARSAMWASRARFWRDVRIWFRGRCSEKFADIRARGESEVKRG